MKKILHFINLFLHLFLSKPTTRKKGASIFVMITNVQLPNVRPANVQGGQARTPIQVLNGISNTPTLINTPLPDNNNGVVKVAIGVPMVQVAAGFQVGYNNTAGNSNVNVMIGDPTGIIALALKGTYVSPDSGSLDPATMFRTFSASPLSTGFFRYAVYGVDGNNTPLVDASAQFGALFLPVTGDINGNSGTVNAETGIDLSSMNNQYRPNILSIDTTQAPIYFTNFNALVVQCLAGYGFTLTFKTGLALGRNGIN